MDQPNCVLVFALGCIGSLAPEAARLYKLRHKRPKKFSSYYFLASGFFAALGGVVAIALPAVTMWAAFYAGVTWPMLISTVNKHRQRAEIRNSVNENQRNIVKASDRTMSIFQNVIEFFRDHADGLFL